MLRLDCRVAEERQGVVKGKAPCMCGEDLVEKGLEIGVNGAYEFIFHEFVNQCLSRMRAWRAGR